MEERNYQSYCVVLDSLTLGPINPWVTYIYPCTNAFFSFSWLMQNGLRTPDINPNIQLFTQTAHKWILSPYQVFVGLLLASPHAAQVSGERGRTAPLSKADVAAPNPRQLLAACGCICTSLSAGWCVPWSPLPGYHWSCCSRGCKNNSALLPKHLAGSDPHCSHIYWVWGGLSTHCLSQFFSSLSLIFLLLQNGSVLSKSCAHYCCNEIPWDLCWPWQSKPWHSHAWYLCSELCFGICTSPSKGYIHSAISAESSFASSLSWLCNQSQSPS